MRALHRFGKRGRPGDGVVLAGVVERLTGLGRPQSGDDGQLLTEPFEPLPHRGERNPVRLVLWREPATAEAQFDAPAAHFVHLCHRDGQGARVAERRGGHQRAEPDARRFPGNRAERHPRIGRPGLAVTAHRQVVVGSEEGRIAELFGGLGNGELVGVAGALLWLDEDTKFHGHLSFLWLIARVERPQRARPAGWAGHAREVSRFRPKTNGHTRFRLRPAPCLRSLTIGPGTIWPVRTVGPPR